MIQGIDISHWQNIDFKHLSPNIKFAYVKACQGATYKDPEFNSNWQKLKLTNLLRGPYVFWDCRYTAQQHWDNLSSLGIDFNKENVLPVMIDLENQENSDLDKMVANNHAHYAAEVTKLIELVELNTKRTPVIYTDPSYLRDYLGGASWPKCPLWLAAIQDKPPRPSKGWDKWTFWQNSWKGKIDGSLTGGQLDMDYFNGTIEELKAL